MAKRPVFIPYVDNRIGVDERIVEFQWFAGMAKVQKQKSIKSLHSAAEAMGISPILEISSKSEEALGVKLSAFNLLITTQVKGRSFSVETAFQSSKVFERGGPFLDLLEQSSRVAKKDVRLKESGNLVGFEFYRTQFPLTPRTFFYDWLYLKALKQNEDLADHVIRYRGFTDIEFNPKKSINCQAYSAALYVSLAHSELLQDALESPESFKQILSDEYNKRDSTINVQSGLI